MVFILAEKVGFEPTWRVTANSISSRMDKVLSG